MYCNRQVAEIDYKDKGRDTKHIRNLLS
jgi:hypothetical protein